MVLAVAELDTLLSSIDTFLSEDYGDAEGLRRSLEVAVLQRMLDFLDSSPALGRAFEMELISSQRMVEILIPPFLKLTAAYISASRQGQTSASSERRLVIPEVLSLLNVLWRHWGIIVIKLLSGEEFTDNHGQLQPVMSQKRRCDLLDGFLEAKFPEVRLACSTVSILD